MDYMLMSDHQPSSQVLHWALPDLAAVGVSVSIRMVSVLVE